MSEKRKTAIGNPLPEAGDLPRIVLVYWRDCCIIDDYDTAEDAWPYLMLWSVGLVLRDDADGIVIAMDKQDKAGDKRMRHVSSIPRENIISLEELSTYRGSSVVNQG